MFFIIVFLMLLNTKMYNINILEASALIFCTFSTKIHLATKTEYQKVVKKFMRHVKKAGEKGVNVIKKETGDKSKGKIAGSLGNSGENTPTENTKRYKKPESSENKPELEPKIDDITKRIDKITTVPTIKSTEKPVTPTQTQTSADNSKNESPYTISENPKTQSAWKEQVIEKIIDNDIDKLLLEKSQKQEVPTNQQMKKDQSEISTNTNENNQEISNNININYQEISTNTHENTQELPNNTTNANINYFEISTNINTFHQPISSDINNQIEPEISTTIFHHKYHYLLQCHPNLKNIRNLLQ